MAGWPVRRPPFDGYQVPDRRAGCASCRRASSVTRIRPAGVQVWTVDEEADMERLLGWGVDGLISNRPDLAVRGRDAFVRGVRL